MKFISLFSDATVYVGGLDEKVSEPLLWELFLQAGPVVNTHMPKDRVTGQHQGEHQQLFVAQNKNNFVSEDCTVFYVNANHK